VKRHSSTAIRVGLFGRLCSGNIGNDVSMESVLAYLRTAHPDIVLDAMTNGPEQMVSRYGIEATELFYLHAFDHRPSKPVRAVWLLLEKIVDAVKIAAWVRRHDVVIVPGMGVLEATLPVSPWQLPYSLYLLAVSGKLFRTKVALISVGASPIKQRTTRWLLNQAAKLAYYRSYRDNESRDAMTQRGLDTSRDAVYPDLAFSIPVPPYDPGYPRAVGIGVMRYFGGPNDRHRAAEVHASYVRNEKLFATWLIDNNYNVRLFFGDEDDESVARDIAAELRGNRPGLAQAAVVVEPVSTFDQVARVVQSVAIVVATRFHNVVCAMLLAKPTISVGYAVKNAAVMADAGLADFCLPAQALDADQIIARFKELESRAPELRGRMQDSAAAKALLLEEQYALLSASLFPSATSSTTALQIKRRQP
jgi:polysaccharide pyruvyl transferase WcaK-like protein